jgi:hypothetical protein
MAPASYTPITSALRGAFHAADPLVAGGRFAIFGVIDSMALSDEPLLRDLASPLLWLYLLIVQIAFLNLVIAIMTDTYFKNASSGQAIRRWSMSRVESGARLKPWMHPMIDTAANP